MPLLTRSLLDVRPLLGVEVHKPLHKVDRLGRVRVRVRARVRVRVRYKRLQPGAHRVTAWGTTDSSA
tara:strand:+ start:103 stop:303 length:201 start_codon:yes stop_codon:yes gene_type:complete